MRLIRASSYTSSYTSSSSSGSAARTSIGSTSDGRTDGRSFGGGVLLLHLVAFRIPHTRADERGGRKRVDDGEYDAGGEWGGATRWGTSRSGDARVRVRRERE